jgi:hypothetical protein
MDAKAALQYCLNAHETRVDQHLSSGKAVTCIYIYGDLRSKALFMSTPLSHS